MSLQQHMKVQRCPECIAKIYSNRIYFAISFALRKDFAALRTEETPEEPPLRKNMSNNNNTRGSQLTTLE